MRTTTTVLAALLATLAMNAVQAADSKVLVLPKAPAPVPQTLPLNAQPTAGGVFIPTSKSGNVGVSVEGLRNPAPGEKGGSLSLTIKTK